MYAGYYKKEVGYDGIRAIILVRIDDDGKAYLRNKDGSWSESEDHVFVWEDMDFDKISEAEAKNIIG